MLGLSRSYFRLSVTDFAIAAFIVVAFANIQLLSGNPVRMTMAFYDHIVIPICLYWLIRVVEPRRASCAGCCGCWPGSWRSSSPSAP